MEKYLLDTNVLLTGMFSPSSPSATVLKMALDGSFRTYIAEISIYEAKRSAERALRNTGIDAGPAIDYGLLKLGAIVLANPLPVRTKRFTKISGYADRFLACVAAENELTWCSNDVDSLSASDYGVSVITPSALSEAKNGVGFHTTMLAMLHSPNTGTIYGSFRPSGNSLPRHFGEGESICIFDQSGFGALRYETARPRFVFQFDCGGFLEVVMSNEPLAERTQFALSYDIATGAKLMISTDGHVRSGTLSWNVNRFVLGEMSIFRTRLGELPMSGTIQKWASLSVALSEQAVKKIWTGKTSIDPLERMSLEDMLVRLTR